MNFRRHRSVYVAALVASLAWSAAAVKQANADFTLTGTAAELVSRGVNANFETPDVDAANNATEQTSTQNLGAGWNFNLISGIANNWGVADTADAFYGNVAPADLPAPFDGRQIGFFNQNNPFTQAEIVSNPIGLLKSGQTYTLNVAVGTRLTAAMNQVAYRVGMRADDGTDLGTFATTLIAPSPTAGIITNLLYTLDMSSVPAYVGDNARVVIGAYNTGNNATGVFTNQNAQANFDNVRLAGTFGDLPAAPSAALTINRQSGEIILSNTGSTNLNILGYSLTSTNGSFDQSGWLEISNHYDQATAPSPGNGSVDNNDPWTILTAAGSSTNLSESELSVGGDGGTLSTSTPIDLGDAWLRTPFQDVQATLLLGDGSTLNVTVNYGGLVIPSGDLNGDGDITGSDWTLFKAGQGTNFTGMSKAQAYLKGDLTGNLSHDLNDFFAFRTAYEAANGGAGSFAQMLAGVPEPGAGLLLALGGLLLTTKLSQRNRWRGVLSMNGLAKVSMFAIVAASICSLVARPAAAQTTIAHWSFDTSSLTTNAGNITGAADTTGSHNAVNTQTAGSGAGSPYTSNAIPVANSILGQYGQGLTLNGSNTVAGGGGQFLTYPNLDELTTVASAPGAPDYSVSYWIKTPANQLNAHQFTAMGDWGTALANPGRFTYGFGFQFTGGVAQMRGQSRNNTTGAGNGQDIFARAVNTATLNDGNWHMLTWTFNTTTGLLSSYFDAALVDTFTSTASNGFNMIRSDSPNGTFGLKGDTGNFVNGSISLDEAYVFNGALTPTQITDLFQTNTPPDGMPVLLTLRADPATGMVELQNNSEEDIALNAYRLTSSTGELNHAGWDAISTGTPISGFPQGNGSGNGWEAPGEASNNVADYNADGAVDAADYVMWRKTNINGAGGYTDWKENFGASGGGTLGGDDNELVEWFLTGESTLAVGESISLGQAFDIGGDENLAFTYTTSQGIRNGIVEYGALGSGGSAVPEPSSAWLMLLATCGVVASVWRRRFHPYSAITGVTACVVVASVAVSSATAAVTNDRIYRFGENGGPPQTQENGAAAQPVGSGHVLTAPTPTTLDHVGPSGSFQTLTASSCNNSAATCPTTNNLIPVYQDLTGLGRTGLGILFDGTDDYLNGFSLGLPSLTRSTSTHTAVYGSGTGTLNYNGVYQRGVQFWAYPHSGAAAEQHVLSDTTEHGVRITAGGNWMLRHGGTNVNSNIAVNFNQWSHVMAAMPVSSQPHRAVLYVNGVALTAHEENYDTTSVVNGQALIVGADTNADGTMIGRNNFFRGVLDELEMFIWGRGYNHLTDTYTDFGTFNFATDNGYAASVLSGVPGDVNNSGGAVNQADVDAFVSGWLSEKRVNSIRVGDLTTFADGDLNFDGITNLTDAHLLLQALPGSGGGGFDLGGFNTVTGLGVPEPSSLLLAGLATALFAARSRARRFA